MKRTALLLIVLAGAALRITQLGEHSLWLDESFTYFRALSLWNGAAILPDSPFQLRHLLWDVLQTPWVGLIPQEIGLRWLAAVSSITAVALAFAVGRHIAGYRAGLLAALVVAAAPVQIQYAQQARQYALVATLGLLLVWVALLSQRWSWARLAVPVTAALLTMLHVVSAMFAGLVGIFLLLGGSRRVRPSAVLTLVLVGVFGGGIIFLETRRPAVGWIEPTTPSDVFAYWQLAAGASLTDHTIIPLTGAWFALLALTLVIGYIATHLLRSGPPEGWLVVGLALLPAAAVLAASALVQPLFVPRYLLSSLVVTHLLIGLALDWLLTRAPVVGRILSIALIGFAFVVTLLLHTNDDLQRADWRGAVEVVASDYQPGDVMLTIYLSPVLYYTAQRPGEFTIIKPPPEVGIADQARATVAQGGRAWILAPLAPDFPEPETPDEWFEPTMGEAEAALLQRLNGIWVYLYTAP